MKELFGKMPDGTEIYAHTIADGDISMLFLLENC